MKHLVFPRMKFQFGGELSPVIAKCQQTGLEELYNSWPPMQLLSNSIVIID